MAAQHTYLKGSLEAAAPGSSFGSNALSWTDMVFWLEHQSDSVPSSHAAHWVTYTPIQQNACLAGKI